MRYIFSAAVLVASMLAFAPAANASGDVGCEPAIKVFHRGFTGCDSMGFLAPGNDTRINLVFLLADLHKQKLVVQPEDKNSYTSSSTYAPQDWASFVVALTPPTSSQLATGDSATSGEGSVCVSDDKGRAGFLAAVAATGDMSAPDRQVLTVARNALKCAGDSRTEVEAAPPTVQSPAAKDFQAYLAAISHFYVTEHQSVSNFAALTSSSQPWVKEAATYMQARTLLLAAQANAFDDYGTLNREGIDAKAVSSALEALKAYVTAYPSGAYADSAKGLMRRAYWLSNDSAAQLAAYAPLIVAHEVNGATLELVSEVDLKLPVEAYTQSAANGLLVAVQLFKELREKQDGDGKPVPGMTRAELENQRPKFSSMPDLFDYLLATRAWFVDKDAKAVLDLIPEKIPGAELTYLEFSRQLLRAAALEKAGDAAARNAYVSLFPFAISAWQRGTLELSLAMYDERHKNIGAVFVEGTPIQDPTIRKQVLQYVAGPILLRQQAAASAASLDERETALFSLLSRDLVQGRFKGFLDDVKLMPSSEEALAQHKADPYPADPFASFRWKGQTSGFACPALLEIAKKLSADDKDINARLCLGDFFRATAIVDEKVNDTEQLGGTGTIFSGQPITRQNIYAETLKTAEATHAQKAYALSRSVRCYEPAHQNDCGGNEQPLSIRKAWFNTLKQHYGDTSWAKELHYYW